jgi:acyl-CoA synthetase (AMP-forming)/AMP-acid ligase II
MLDAFEWQAAENGDRTAHTVVVDGEREEVSLTFAELARRARAIAAELQALGRTGDRVLVLCPVSVEYVCAVCACFYSGFVAVPSYVSEMQEPATRLKELVQDTGARIGVTTQDLLPRLQHIPGLSHLHWILTDRVPGDLEDAWKRPPIQPESLALLIGTSGSTSVPKIVMVSHGNLLHTSRVVWEGTSHGENDRMVVVTAPHHSVVLRQGIVYPAYAGIPVTHLSPEAVSERPARWLETISRSRATMSDVPNFLFDLSVRSVTPEARADLDLSCVRFIRNGGEAVRPDSIARFEAYFAPCGMRAGVVRPGYGLTEAVRVACSLPPAPVAVRTLDRVRLENGEVVELGRDDGAGRTLVGQGVPSPGQRLEVVDPQTRTRCEPGRVGEIWLAGAHVALGYWNRPEETRAAFGARLANANEGFFFRTGDLGFLHKGELFITGRLKEIIIVRGRKLSPEHLETSLRQCHPALRAHAGAAFALDVGEEERLTIVHEVDVAALSPQSVVAQFIAPASPQSGDSLGKTGAMNCATTAAQGAQAEGIRDIVSAIRRDTAIRHGVQAHTVVLVPPGAIPRVGPGKIGRAECRSRLAAGTLPVLLHDVLDLAPPRRPARDERTHPRTPTERTLAAIWEQTLGVDGVGIRDTFADLGGDSLLSLQVLLGIKQAGLLVTSEDIRHYSTISALATAIDARQIGVNKRRGPAVGSVPLTSNQRWLLESEDHSLVVGAIVLTQRKPADEASTGHPRALDPLLLERAAQHLVFHHDALRLRCYQEAAGRWRAEYLGHTPPGLVSFLDLSQLPAKEQRTRGIEEITRLRRTLDVEAGALFRIGIIHLGENRDLVALCSHHLIADLVSIEILIRDLDALCTQLSRGQSPQLPARTATISQWHRHTTAFARSSAARQEAAYWNGVLAHPPSAPPLDFPEQSRSAGPEQRLSVRLGREQTSALKRLRQIGLSLSDAVHYALARSLSDQVGRPAGIKLSSTVLFHTLSHSRGPLFAGLDLSRTVGFLATPFPMLLELHPGAVHAEAATAVRAQMQAIPHHGMGYPILLDFGDTSIRAQLAGPGRASRVQLNYRGDSNRPYDGLNIFRRAVEWETASHATGGENQPIPWHPRIELAATIEEGQLLLWTTCHSRAYRASTVERLTGRMRDILTQLARESRR